ncbi:MAG: VWA domain-containing protein [Candidatus Sulfopaludibacter sp.]|nr:VWA domain-containing protein [Candidatus Sulfopaludibacter sp.]
MRRLVFTFALACLLAGAFQFRSDVGLVVIHATVTTARGDFISGLPASSFHVAENGRAQVLKQAVQEDIPVTLGIVTDDSGSMRRLHPVVLEAIRRMNDDLNPEDEVFLAHFSMHFAVDLPPTAGALDLRSALAALAPRNTTGQWQAGTNLFDCLEQALIYTEKNSRRDKAALLLVTDGDDTTSLLTLKQTIAAVGHRRPLIYAIGLPGDDSRGGRAALRKITEASGGQAFFPKYVEQLPAIAGRIAREMRSQYTLTYTPETRDPDEAYRALIVKVDTPPKSPPLLVRARTGYYATSAQSRE